MLFTVICHTDNGPVEVSCGVWLQVLVLQAVLSEGSDDTADSASQSSHRKLQLCHRPHRCSWFCLFVTHLCTLLCFLWNGAESVTATKKQIAQRQHESQLMLCSSPPHHRNSCDSSGMWELDLWGFPVVPVCRYLVLWVYCRYSVRSVKGWKLGSVFSVVLLTECFCHYRLAALHNTHMDAGSHGFRTVHCTNLISLWTSASFTFLIFRDFLLCTLKMFIKTLLELVYMTLLQTCLLTMKWCW